MKKVLVFVILGALVFSFMLSAQTKGITRQVVTFKGQRVILYEKSYALLIGVSEYRYWPDLENIPDELKRLESALEKEKDNPFEEEINKKAKRIYKNSKGFWEVDYGDGIVMVYIPPGSFRMGSNDFTNAKPPHIVYLDGYWMGKTEVTVKQYMEFVNETNSHYPAWLEKGSKYNINTGSEEYYKIFGSALKGDNYPIVGIYWDDAKDYCDWLSNKTGLRFKLPTEAQWEKAARGTDGRKYPWGDHVPYYSGEYYANYDPLYLKEDGFRFTAPVGSFPQGASPYCLLDMAGNVWEWCSDWYDKNYYKNSLLKNPTGPEKGDYRVVRGGGWYYLAGVLRCANRSCIRPSYRNWHVGFRLCQDSR